MAKQLYQRHFKEEESEIDYKDPVVKAIKPLIQKKFKGEEFTLAINMCTTFVTAVTKSDKTKLNRSKDYFDKAIKAISGKNADDVV